MQIYSTDSSSLEPAQLLILLEGELCLSNPETSIRLDLGESYFSGTQNFQIECNDSVVKYLILSTELDSVDCNCEIDELTLALIDEDFFSQPKSESYKNAAANYILQRILPQQEIAVPRQDALIEKILQFIERNLDEKLSVELIGTEFELSKMQLIRLFAKEGKQPVMSEVRSLRLEKASQLLETSELTIQQIAASIGFADSASFSHFFKKNTGKSPRQLRDEQKWLI
jgi:AraC-like DNA-binding protein